MRILGRDLKRIIKEEISRAAINEDDGIDLAVARSKASSLASGAGSDSNISSMAAFFEDVLSGRKIVTSSRNTPGENLYVNQALTAFEQITGLPDGDLTSFPPSTYPEEGVAKLQKMTQNQADGDFGRQTLAAAVTGGRARISPTTLETPESRKHFARLMAMLVNAPAPDDSQALADALANADYSAGAAADMDLGGPRRASPAERRIPKSLLLAMIDNPESMQRIAKILGMSEEDVYERSLDLQDHGPQPLQRWLALIAGRDALSIADADMAEIEAAVAGVHGAPESVLTPAYRPSSVSMNESHNLTSRLMERWIK